MASLHCAAFSGSVALRGKRRAGYLRAVLPVFALHLAATGHARRPASRRCAPAAPAHEAAQQARNVRKRPRTLRACGSDRSLQPPSPCRRGSPRFVARATRRLTGLSAANDITRCWSQASCLSGAARGIHAALTAPRPSNPRYVQLAASASMRLAFACRSCGTVASVLRQQPARHPWLASPSASSVIARGHAKRPRPAFVPRA